MDYGQYGYIFLILIVYDLQYTRYWKNRKQTLWIQCRCLQWKKGTKFLIEDNIEQILFHRAAVFQDPYIQETMFIIGDTFTIKSTSLSSSKREDHSFIYT